MHIYAFFSLLLAGVLVLGSWCSAYAQSVPAKAAKRVITNEIALAAKRGSVQTAGILSRLEQMQTQGEHAATALRREISAARAKNISDKREAFSLFEKDQDRKHIMTAPILATASNRLPRLQHPFIGQDREFADRYTQAMQDFFVFRKEFNGRVFYETSSLKLGPEETRRWLEKLSPVQSRVRALHARIYPGDEGLAAAVEYLNFAAGEINPMLKSVHAAGLPRLARRFNQDEFFLEGDWFNRTLSMSYPRREAAGLPSGLRVAVINDEEHALDLYRAWQKQGVFGDWKISYYKQAEPVVADIFSGNKYDLIITDMIVTGSSVLNSVRQLRLHEYEIPIIACSSNTKWDINAQQMFSQGFDGYISFSDIIAAGPSVLSDGLSRYFFYQDYYQWGR